MNGNNLKSPTIPPLPLRGTSPKGGSEKSAPARGAGRPNGLTEGVWYDEWQQLKATNDTPFATSRHFPQGGQQGRGAPPPKGAARELGRFISRGRLNGKMLCYLPISPSHSTYRCGSVRSRDDVPQSSPTFAASKGEFVTFLVGSVRIRLF